MPYEHHHMWNSVVCSANDKIWRAPCHISWQEDIRSLFRKTEQNFPLSWTFLFHSTCFTVRLTAFLDPIFPHRWVKFHLIFQGMFQQIMARVENFSFWWSWYGKFWMLFHAFIKHALETFEVSVYSNKFLLRIFGVGVRPNLENLYLTSRPRTVFIRAFQMCIVPWNV